MRLLLLLSSSSSGQFAEWLWLGWLSTTALSRHRRRQVSLWYGCGWDGCQPQYYCLAIVVVMSVCGMAAAGMVVNHSIVSSSSGQFVVWLRLGWLSTTVLSRRRQVSLLYGCGWDGCQPQYCLAIVVVRSVCGMAVAGMVVNHSMWYGCGWDGCQPQYCLAIVVVKSVCGMAVAGMVVNHSIIVSPSSSSGQFVVWLWLGWLLLGVVVPGSCGPCQLSLLHVMVLVYCCVCLFLP